MSDWITAGFERALVRDMLKVIVVGFVLGALAFGGVSWTCEHIDVTYTEGGEDG